jgi:molybdopterin molybdotransferase
MTGAPCPPGAEAVVPKEEAHRNDTTITLPQTVRPWQNITPIGSECAVGSVPMRAGDVITPLAIAVLATFGLQRVPVYQAPSVAIITTGNELVRIDQTPGPAQIRNSNGPMLAAMARMANVRDVLIGHANDSIQEFSSALENAREKDIVVLTGAVSEGKYDLVPQALAHYGATVVFHKVAQRPGKPILFATKQTQLIFALPGNPLSCHLGFHRYVNTAIRRWTGRPPSIEPRPAILGAPITIRGPRTVFQLARAHMLDGINQVTPLVGRGSADIYAVCRANAMIRFEPEAGEIAAGTPVLYEPVVPCHE